MAATDLVQESFAQAGFQAVNDSLARKQRTIDSITLLKAETLLQGSLFVKGFASVGDGGHGDFSWNASDLSVNVTNDPQSGIYVAPASDPTGAGGAWVRQNVRFVTPAYFGALGDNAADDTIPMQAAFDFCQLGQTPLYINEGRYRLTDRIITNNTFDIRCDLSASMRWDVAAPTVNNCGILFNFPDGSDTLVRIELPQLFSPATASNFTTPGYSLAEGWTYDINTRVGNAVDIVGSNRLDVYVHYMNGWKAATCISATPTSTCDNIDVRHGVVDFCERGLDLNADTLGFEQISYFCNTSWSKHPLYFNTATGYVRAAHFHIVGALVNEDGGCPVYTVGDGLGGGTTIVIDDCQAGERGDSTPTTTTGLVCPYIGGDSVGEVVTGTAQSATGTTIVMQNNDNRPDDCYNGSVISITGGTGSGQTRTITDYVSGSRTATVGAAWTTTPDATSTYSIDVLYDGMGNSPNIGYFGGKHCVIEIGAAFNHPVTDEGAQSPVSEAGDTIRIRDGGRNNHIVVKGANTESNLNNQAIALATTIGEDNYNGGVGGAPFAKNVYSSAAINLAPGAAVNRHFYHQMLTGPTKRPITVIPYDEGMMNNDITALAQMDLAENRHAYVRFKNNGASTVNTTVRFWLSVQ